MPSKRTIRISDIPPHVEEGDVKAHIACLANTYKPSSIRTLLRQSTKPSPSAVNEFRLSLGTQATCQVATVTLASVEAKSYLIERRKQLNGWHIDDDFRGLTVLHTPEKHEIDVCAIHGPGGNAFDTWDSSGMMWLRDLLPSSRPFDTSRIITFGYNGGLVDRSASVGIRHWAIEFLNQISIIRSKSEDRRKPLILICHSLGGLVGQEAMVRLGNFPHEYSNVSLHQCGLVFLGTPHSGTHEADWNEAFLTIAELAFGVRSRDIIDKLQAFNDPSVASKEAFAALRPVPPYFCFAEGKNTKVLRSYRKMVSQDSAGLNGVTAVMITDVDYTEICKFARKSGAHLLVLDRLARLREALLGRSVGEHSIHLLPEHIAGRDAISNHSVITTFGNVTSSGNSRVLQIGNWQSPGTK